MSELRFRNKFGLEILMIKKTKELFSEDESENKLVMPAPEYVIEENDILVLFGTDDKIAVTNNW